jgi:hypothetical protein
MMKSVFAFLLGVATLAASAWPSQNASAAALYYDMGTVHVQFHTEDCGLRTLAVTYQIEYAEENRTSFITSFKPKIESVLFTDLNEHLAETQNTRVRSIHKVMKRGVDSVLGEGVASDILITSTSVLDR